MDWTCLGHAMWLVEAAGLRLLFDPLLGDSHHDGVFGLTPPRRLDEQALRPDLVVVSHRHPDHFDLPSLHRLARLAPEAIVLTPDPFVGRTCQRLGFTHVSLLPDDQHLDLDGLQLLTTPSRCHVTEWGLMLATKEGTAWNQVDTVLGSPEQIALQLQRGSEALGAPSLAEGPDLGVLCWQPLVQVEHALGQAFAFPHARWARSLSRMRATSARHAVLGAAGGRYHSPGDWQQSWAWPVSYERAARDLGQVAPETRPYPLRTGDQWRLRGGEVEHLSGGGSELIEHLGDEVDRSFHPRHMPAVEDHSGRDAAEALAIIEPWLAGVLAPALPAPLASQGIVEARLQLDVVLSGSRRSWSLEVAGGETRLRRGEARDPDMINTVAASDLADVIEARAAWGRPLLAGRLRTMDRLYRIVGGRLEKPRLPPFFLYLALPYERAFERWVERSLDQLGC